MAYDPYAYDPNQNPEVRNQLQQQVMTSSAPSAGPGPSNKAVGATAPQATPAQPFQNLQAYLTANAPRTSQQGADIAGNLSNQYGQIKSDIAKGASDVGNQITAGYAQPNPEIISAAEANPTEFASKPENVKAFQNLYNNTYGGPSSFEDTGTYADLSGKVSKALSDTSNLNSFPGVQTYLAGQNPNATKGGNVLDSVLLAGNPEAYNQVIQAANQFKDLPDYLSQVTGTTNANIDTARANAAQSAADLQKQFTGEGGIIPTFQSGISSGVEAARKAATDRTAQEMNDFYAGKANPQELADLGITNPGDVGQLTNLKDILGRNFGTQFDTSGYFTPVSANTAIRPETFAKPEDYQKATALSLLTGQDLSSFLNPGNASLAGTAPNALSKFNTPGAISDAANMIKQSDANILNQTQNIMGGGSTFDQNTYDTFARNTAQLSPAQQQWFNFWTARMPTGTGGPTTTVSGNSNAITGALPGETVEQTMARLGAEETARNKAKGITEHFGFDPIGALEKNPSRPTF